MYGKGMVVQFLENHKWAGSLGIITKVKYIKDDVKYMIAVPIPMEGTAYIYSMQSENDIALVNGFATLVPRDEEDEDN